MPPRPAQPQSGPPPPATDPATESPTAGQFLARMERLRSAEEEQKIRRYFKSGAGQYGAGDVFMGVRMGQVFALAREFVALPPAELERLLESPLHEVRAGALKIMALQARGKRTTEERRRELYELYRRRIDRINNWDLVDVSAGDVVGGYLIDTPRHVLDELARSTDLWERRTAIVATSTFIRLGQLDDTYRIAGILLRDEQDLIQKATGGWLREAGKRDRPRLVAFLEANAATMPRTTLRYATEHFDREERARYLAMKPPDGR